MFGAKRAYCTDLDPCALAAVKENCRANGISPARLSVKIGNIITDEKIFHAAGGADCYDIVVANILTEILVPLTPVACRCLKKGGLFITSGIIGDEASALPCSGQASDRLPPKAEQVITAMKAAGMELAEMNHAGEWFSITARKA
jgi:ribosomal protein L11 methyltransferase